MLICDGLTRSECNWQKHLVFLHKKLVYTNVLTSNGYGTTGKVVVVASAIVQMHLRPHLTVCYLQTKRYLSSLETTKTTTYVVIVSLNLVHVLVVLSFLPRLGPVLLLILGRDCAVSSHQGATKLIRPDQRAGGPHHVQKSIIILCNTQHPSRGWLQWVGGIAKNFAQNQHFSTTKSNHLNVICLR